MKIPYCLPQHISSEQFLSEYWQKKPLLIKQGLPQLADMFEPDDILGLALEPDASARLITQHLNTQTVSTQTQADTAMLDQPTPEQWQVKNSPLVESDYDNLPAQWTVLVQNLEQWSPELGRLWQAFDFIPQWQRDDIMVSFAPKGGSVGKHYDDYDVFLAQGYGHRHWQLGKYCDDSTEFMSGQPIRIFDDMGTLIFDEILEPGDVLYVPPKLSHYGVATDDCLTFSFGFRRPNLMQVIDSIAEVTTSQPSAFVPLRLDQHVQPSGELTTDSITAIKSQLLDFLNSTQGDALLTQAIAEVVSKRQYDVLIADEVITPDELTDALTDRATLQADYSSRLLLVESLNHAAADATIYANGQRLDGLTEPETKALIQIANGHNLTGEDLHDIDNDSLMEWLENGWVWLDFPE